MSHENAWRDGVRYFMTTNRNACATLQNHGLDYQNIEILCWMFFDEHKPPYFHTPHYFKHSSVPICWFLHLAVIYWHLGSRLKSRKSEMVFVNYCSEPRRTEGKYIFSIHIVLKCQRSSEAQTFARLQYFCTFVIEIKDRMLYCMEEPKRGCRARALSNGTRSLYALRTLCRSGGPDLYDLKNRGHRHGRLMKSWQHRTDWHLGSLLRREAISSDREASTTKFYCKTLSCWSWLWLQSIHGSI